MGPVRESHFSRQKSSDLVRLAQSETMNDTAYVPVTKISADAEIA